MNENATDMPHIDSTGTSPEAAVQKVKGADLINLFNYVNFREGTVFVGFHDPAVGGVRVIVGAKTGQIRAEQNQVLE